MKKEIDSSENRIDTKKLIYKNHNFDCEYRKDPSKKGIFNECHCVYVIKKLDIGQNIISCKGCNINNIKRKRRK